MALAFGSSLYRKKDTEIITSCCNCSNFRIQTQLQICAELYTRVLSLQDQNSLISDYSSREILTDLLFCHHLSFVLYVFRWDVVFIYWAKHF